MKVEDLRIGNWVIWNNDKALISQILEHEVCFKCGEDCLLSEIQPIPITEEILIKYGFRNTWSKYVYESDTMLDIRINDGCFYLLANTIQIRQIEYLHELQNSFYFLTGKELKYNE